MGGDILRGNEAGECEIRREVKTCHECEEERLEGTFDNFYIVDMPVIYRALFVEYVHRQ